MNVANPSYPRPFAHRGSGSEGDFALVEVTHSMPPMLVDPSASSSVNSLKPDARRAHIFDSPSHSEQPTSLDNITQDLHLSYLQPIATLSRHYTANQDQAEHHQDEEATVEDVSLTPHLSNRREGFMVETQPSVADERTNSRNPLPPEQSRSASPPPLEEILRRRTIDDADDIQNIQLQHASTGDSRLAAAPRSSTTESSRAGTRRSSIAVFAKGLASRVPDMRMFDFEKPIDGPGTSRRRSSQDARWIRSHKKDRKLSFAPLPTMMAKQSYAADPSLPTICKEPPIPTTPKKPPLKRAVGSGLRDRRKVKLDLPLPVEISNIPARSRSPAVLLHSFTPSRPRSPKTPWIRVEQPKWDAAPVVISPPIFEEDHIQSSIMGTHSRTQGGMGLLPGSDPIFSSSPKPIDHPTIRMRRDRCHITRPRFPRSRSGRSGRSGTSESIIASTPDGTQSPEELRLQWEQQARLNGELQELSQSTTSRRGRRRWKTSSDDGRQTPELINRRFSFNTFKRTNRNSDQSIDKDKKQAIEPSTRKWYSKQPVPFLNKPAGLERMVVPPVFIPPGVNRIPTPPMFDADGEVKGKLADFFFDVQSGAAPRRNKPKHIPGGYWDSDALLISLTTDLNLADDEEENEGPEGPSDEDARTPLHLDLNGTPGLATRGSSGYLGIATMNPGIPSPALRNEAFFRIPRDEVLHQHNLTALARQEDEDRRKFEWMVPEHYPTSPLCPLHEKYKGPWTGLCYWHGKRQGDRVILNGEYASGRDKHGNLKPLGNAVKYNVRNAAVVQRPIPRRGVRGWEVGMYDSLPAEDRRRLASLTS